MRKKTKCSDRRRRALRRCAWLAAILAVLHVTGMAVVFPGAAIRQIADRCDVENPAVVDWFYDGTLPVSRLGLHALVDGERSMMLAVTGFHPLMGWYDRGWAETECWDGSGLYAGVYGHTQDEKTVSYLFGKIDDPAIETLRLVQYRMNEETREEYPVEIPLPEDCVFEKHGTRYLLTKIDSPAGDHGRRFEITGFDRGGNCCGHNRSSLENMVYRLK